MTDTLFPELVPIEPEQAESLPGISAGRKLTIRQRRDVDHGRHPLTGTALTTVEGATCGNCRFRVPGKYAKCHYRHPLTGRYPYITSGPATDCRAWWPAFLAMDKSTDCPTPAEWIIRIRPCCQHLDLSFACPTHQVKLAGFAVNSMALFVCDGCAHRCVNAMFRFEPIKPP